MKITVFIAEDDPDMRHVIKKVVEEAESIEVIGEAGDGIEYSPNFLTAATDRAIKKAVNIPVRTVKIPRCSTGKTYRGTL